jgi:hypothetical protein
MGFYLVQGGSSLWFVDTAGTKTQLTLPSGVTLSTTRRPRFAVFGQRVIMTNSPSVNLVINPDGTVNRLTPATPGSAPVLGNTGSGNLSGVYRARTSFLILDEFGDVVSESPIGPASGASPDLTTEKLSVSGVPVSTDSDVNARRIYRTLTGGSVYFHWLDLDGNTLTTFTDDAQDAALSTLSAPDYLGVPPGATDAVQMKIITEWRGRLWGVSSARPDYVLYTPADTPYAWPAANSLIVQPLGADSEGNVAFMRRRDELGIAKRDSISKIIGSDETNFEPKNIINGVGCVAQETVVIIRDTAYFLSEDGVYTWGADGLNSISKEHVDPWFTKDTYFNRSKFSTAFAKWNQKYDLYELHLPSPSQTTLDRWVAYDVRKKIWLGPHKTGAFTPTCAAAIEDANDLAVPVMGSSAGAIWKQNQSGSADGTTAVEFNAKMRPMSMDEPDLQKYFGQLSLISRKEAEIEGGTPTVSVYAAVGDVDASEQAVITADLELGRQLLRRLSTSAQPVGRYLTLRFYNNFLNEESADEQPLMLYGIEFPWGSIGRR